MPTSPVQMTAKTLNAFKGWPSMSAVDFVGQLHDDLANTRVYPGTVVHIDPASDKFKLGIGDNTYMPMFLFNGSDDADVQNYGGDPAADQDAWVPSIPAGDMMALVAIGAYELVSTQFVDDDYAANDHLTAAVSGDDAGKLAVGTVYTDTICGVVSRGVVDNGYGRDALAFWPVYIPPTA